MQYDTTGIEIGLIPKYSPAFLSECHEVADIFIGRDHLDLGDRFCDMDIGSRLREIFGVRDPDVCTCMTFPFYELRSRSRIEGTLISSDKDLVCHLRTRDDHVHPMFTPEPFLHDIEMEESEESTAKSIPECGRGFMICDEGRIIHLELLHSILHLRIFIGLDRKYTREYVGSDPLESCDGMLGIIRSSEYRIADSCLRDRLQSRDDIADLTFIEDIGGRILGTKTSDFERFDLGSSVDEFELVSLPDLSGEELQIDNDSLVRIILRVEYESLDC